MAQGFVYSAQMVDTSVSGAITILQVKAGAADPIQLLRAFVSQRTLTVSAQQRIQIVRKSAAATVTSFTPIKYNPASPASGAAGGTAATGYNGSAEGTDGDVVIADIFNILAGWLWVPTPEERIVVPAGGIIALKFPTAPGSAMTVAAGLVWEEWQ